MNALYATFGLVAGTLTWPLMILFSLITRTPKKIIVILLIVGTAVCVLYFYDYKSVSGHADPKTFYSHIKVIILHTLGVLGNPICQLGPLVGLAPSSTTILPLLMGSMGLLVFCFIFLQINLSNKVPELFKIFCIFLILYALMEAFLIGAGRYNFGLSQSFSSRYATPALIFWLALFGLISSYLEFEPGKASWFQSMVYCASGIMIAFLLVQQQYFVQYFEDYVQQRQQMGLAFILDLPVEEKSWLYPIPNQVQNLMPYLEKKNTSLYHLPVVKLLGKKLEDQVKIINKTQIACAIDFYQPYCSKENTGARITGWAYDLAEDKSIKYLVFIDETGVVVGLGLSGTRRPDVLAAMNKSKDIRCGWLGFFKFKGSNQPKIRVFGVTDEGAAAFPLSLEPMAAKCN
ncbi:MAG: hypothetical protein HQK55_08810 [Deltaproteobacteria bacterium]|nr:hypothetical protein [Deltaproteobacteria bacterium]